MRRGVRRDAVEIVRRRQLLVEIATEHREAAVDGVDVRVLESGRHGPSPQVDDAGARTRELLDRGIGPDRDDPAIADGERRCPATCGVHRGDPARGQDQVGGHAGLQAQGVAGTAGILASAHPTHRSHLTTRDDVPSRAMTSVHLLHAGYTGDRVASTVVLVRDADAVIVVDPGMVANRSLILDPLAALGVAPRP